MKLSIKPRLSSKASADQLHSVRLEIKEYPSQQPLPDGSVFATYGKQGIRCGDIHLYADAELVYRIDIQVLSSASWDAPWWGRFLRQFGWAGPTVNFRRAGLGGKLLQAAIHWAKKQGANHLCGDITETGMEQEWLTGWYQSKGFTISEPRVGAMRGTVRSIWLDLRSDVRGANSG
jgi:GNAT superfamily N-acetyltransferase